MSFQARPVKHSLLSLGPSLTRFDLPAQYCALGNFTINALPEGYVEPLGHGKYRVCVNKVYFFINNIFNFEENAYLGSWELGTENERLTQTVPNILFPIHNRHFREFQRHGYGRYFPVLSPLHEMKDFYPQCLEYSLEK